MGKWSGGAPVTREVVSLVNPTTAVRTFTYSNLGTGPHVLHVRAAGERATVDPVLQDDLIFADGFESGNFSAWTSADTDGSDLSVTTTAALVGTYGMQALINDTVGIFVRDYTSADEPRYRARFYFDPNSVTIPGGNSHDIFKARTLTDSAFSVQLYVSSGGAYKVRAQIYKDDTSYLGSANYTISDALHSIEIDWAAATAPGANNGYLSPWIDGVLKETLSGIDNDTLRIEEARLGPTGGIDVDTSGTEYFDAFESRRQTFIGP